MRETIRTEAALQMARYFYKKNNYSQITTPYPPIMTGKFFPMMGSKQRSLSLFKCFTRQPGTEAGTATDGKEAKLKGSL